MQNKIYSYTVANSLVVLSIFFTALTFIIPSIYTFGMNHYFYSSGVYHMWFVQMFTSQFLHGGLLHLAMNSFFILYFGNALERMIWVNKFLVFFIFNAIFLGFVITFLGWATSNTVGISGFALAVLTYYTLELRSLKHPEWSGGATAIVINVLIGLTPWISFLGHFGWMVFGGIYWILNQKKK